MKHIVISLLMAFTVLCVFGYERPIVVVIPSYNNESLCERNLASIYSQQYTNYIVIYVDDCSQDGTYQKVADYVKKVGQSHRTILVKNNKRRGAMANLYYAIISCADQAIIATVDGDDWLAGPGVFERLNQEYKNPNVWLTYGQYREHPTGAIGFSKMFPSHEIKNNSYRSGSLEFSHLRTFYAGLFKKIALKDLQYQGDFYTMTWDKAMMLPMFEMANGRFKFIPDVLYIYNNDNPINDHKVDHKFQLFLYHEIKAKSRYAPLNDVSFISRDYTSAYESCDVETLRAGFGPDADLLVGL